MVVKEPGGKYSPDLLKACEDHFSRIYPDYVNAIDHETVMCPPAFPFEYIAPTGEASEIAPNSNCSTFWKSLEMKLTNRCSLYRK